MAMHSHPAVALEVTRGGIKLAGRFSQLFHQSWIHGHHGHNAVSRMMGMIARQPNPLKPLLASLVLLVGGGGAVQASQELSGGCPRLQPNNPTAVQPLRIPASEVEAKNARGCLSEADAIYGADGCPMKLCGKNAGVIQLPAP